MSIQLDHVHGTRTYRAYHDGALVWAGTEALLLVLLRSTDVLTAARALLEDSTISNRVALRQAVDKAEGKS